MNKHFYKLDTMNKETYVLGGFNIILYFNNKYVFEKSSTPFSNIIPYDVRKCYEFCISFSFEQFISSCRGRINCNSSKSLIIFLQVIQIEFFRKESLTLEFLIISLYFVLGKLLKLKQGHINKSVSAH